MRLCEKRKTPRKLQEYQIFVETNNRYKDLGIGAGTEFSNRVLPICKAMDSTPRGDGEGGEGRR